MAPNIGFLIKYKLSSFCFFFQIIFRSFFPLALSSPFFTKKKPTNLAFPSSFHFFDGLINYFIYLTNNKPPTTTNSPVLLLLTGRTELLLVIPAK